MYSIPDLVDVSAVGCGQTPNDEQKTVMVAVVVVDKAGCP
jgi:hypothetical protein